MYRIVTAVVLAALVFAPGCGQQPRETAAACDALGVAAQLAWSYSTGRDDEELDRLRVAVEDPALPDDLGGQFDRLSTAVRAGVPERGAESATLAEQFRAQQFGVDAGFLEGEHERRCPQG